MMAQTTQPSNSCMCLTKHSCKSPTFFHLDAPRDPGSDPAVLVLFWALSTKPNALHRHPPVHTRHKYLVGDKFCEDTRPGYKVTMGSDSV
eukprot:1147275-Pelagomonas_calceolata.AAC.1